MMTQKVTAAHQRQLVVERMWLNYYNNSLLEMGIITPQQHRRMQVMINTRTKVVGQAD